MKRSYEMMENKSSCEHDKCSNCDCSSEQEHYSECVCTCQAKNNSTFSSKRTKFMDYIKDSFRSVRRWFVGGERNDFTVKESSIITTTNLNDLFSKKLNIDTIDNRYQKSIKPMDYSIGIRSPLYKVSTFKHPNAAPLQKRIAPVEFAKEYMEEMNSVINSSLINVQRNLITPIPNNNINHNINHNPDHNFNMKPLKNSWGSNSFLLKSSSTLHPRRFNDTRNIDQMGIIEHPIGSLFTSTKHPITRDLTNYLRTIQLGSPKLEHVDTNLNAENEAELQLKNTNAIGQNIVDFSKEYFNIKIAALQALTSNDYHEKEKDFIIQRIKEHQEKRRQLKTQYESLSINVCFELPEKELFPEFDHQLLQKYLDSIENNSINGFRIKLPNDNVNYKDMKTLLGLNWLNDEVINFYLDLIKKRSCAKTNYPLVHSFSTFFYEKLSRVGYKGVKRWTKNINIFEKRFLLIPIHLAVHWCICVVDNAKQTINYYDSLLTPNYDCIERIKNYLMEEHNTKYSKPINFEEWSFDCPQRIPRQQNGSDCGVFACTFGEYTSRGASFDFTQENMTYFRQKMIYEIFQNKLLL